MMNDNSFEEARRIREKILFQKKVSLFIFIFFVFIFLGFSVYFLFIRDNSNDKNKNSDISTSKVKEIPENKPVSISDNKRKKREKKSHTKKNNKIIFKKNKNSCKNNSSLIETINSAYKKEKKEKLKIHHKMKITKKNNNIRDIVKKSSSYGIDQFLDDLYLGKSTSSLTDKPDYNSKNDYLKMALIYCKKGIKNRAIQLLKEGKEKFPDSGQILLFLSTLLIETGNIKDAENIINSFGASLLGEPAFLKKITQYDFKSRNVFRDNYNIFPNKEFFYLEIKKIYGDDNQITSISFNKIINKIIYHIDGIGNYLLSMKNFSKKLFSNSFSLTISKKGYINLKYGGISNNKIELVTSSYFKNLASTLEIDSENITHMTLSPNGNFLAIYKRNGLFSLIDTNSGMIRYSFNRMYEMNKANNPFSFTTTNKSLVTSSLYYLFRRDKKILSISKLDLSRYDEKRIFSMNISSNKFQAIDVYPNKIVLISLLSKGKRKPSIYMMGYFGKNPVELIKNASYPSIVNYKFNFVFLRDGDIYNCRFISLKEDELINLLKRLIPKKALSLLERLKPENKKMIALKKEIINNRDEIESGILFYRGKLFEELNHKEIAISLYKIIINSYPLSSYYEGATSSIEKLNLMMNKKVINNE